MANKTPQLVYGSNYDGDSLTGSSLLAGASPRAEASRRPNYATAILNPDNRESFQFTLVGRSTHRDNDHRVKDRECDRGIPMHGRDANARDG